MSNIKQWPPVNKRATVKMKDCYMHDFRDCTLVTIPSEWTKLDLMKHDILQKLCNKECFNTED